MTNILVTVVILVAFGSFHITLANSDVNRCVDPLIQFMDDFVHSYMLHHPLPNATLANRATFYHGKLTGTSKAKRLDPTTIYVKNGNKVILETRVLIPLFKVSYKCKYQLYYEYPCPNVNVTTRNAIALAAASFDMATRLIHLDDMQLISADTDIQIAPAWLKPLVEQFTDERIKAGFADTYKNIINQSHLKLPEQFDASCKAAAFSNELKPLPLLYKKKPGK